MFMESSSPIKQNDTARLLSPYFGPTSGGQCFQFWYHMYGQIGYKRTY
jgi:meprin B